MFNSTFKPSAKPMKPKKLRKCCMCKTSEVANVFAKLCTNIDCVIAYGNRERDKRIKKESARIARLEREDRTRRKEALKSRPEWLADVQVAFNRMIRARDAGMACIDCGKPFEPQKHGGAVDAGHYLSRGSAPHLRFNENNCFAQRKNCNRPGGTTREKFRAGVIDRIGLAAVEELESDQSFPKWTIDELKQMKAEFNRRANEYLKRNN